VHTDPASLEAADIAKEILGGAKSMYKHMGVASGNNSTGIVRARGSPKSSRRKPEFLVGQDSRLTKRLRHSKIVELET